MSTKAHWVPTLPHISPLVGSHFLRTGSRVRLAHLGRIELTGWSLPLMSLEWRDQAFLLRVHW